MSGGKSPKYPAPTAEELALQRTQNELLQTQMEMIRSGQLEQNMVAPYLYKQMGLIPSYDASGKLTGFTNDPEFEKQQTLTREFQRQQMELFGEQTEAMREQQRLQNLLNPFTYEAMGLKPITDAEGKITGFEKRALTEDETRRSEIEKLQNERAIAALKGELPIDPTTTRELGKQETNLRDTLRRQLGAGWETSTAGQEALQRFGETKAGVLSAAQRGELTLAEQLGQAREATSTQRDMWRQSQMRGSPLPQPNYQGDFASSQFQGLNALSGRNFQRAGELASVYGGVNQNLQTLGNWRGQQFQSDVMKQQQKAQEQQQWGAAGGAVAAVAAAAAIISTRRAKKDISPSTGAQSLRDILRESA